MKGVRFIRPKYLKKMYNTLKELLDEHYCVVHVMTLLCCLRFIVSTR